jgi:phage tail sheath protein FI
MTASYLHGIETIELTTGPIPVREVKSAVVFLVGTAPVQDTVPAGMSSTAWYQQIVNQPTLILSPSDAVNYFGPPTPGYTIPYALDAIFDQGGTTCVVVNVFNPMSNTNATTGLPDPTTVTDAQVIGGVDPTTGLRTGLAIIDQLYTQFGFTAKMILAPFFCEHQDVAAAMTAAADSHRAFALIDAPVGLTTQQVITARGSGGQLNTSSYRTIICYPHLQVYDEALNAPRLEPFSQRLAGVIARVDHEKGYWWSPSNHEIENIIGIERPITSAINNPNTDTNLLNANGIVTVFNSFGTGYRVWGDRSAAYPANTDPLTFISVQRTADIIAESIEYSTLQFLDKPLTVVIDGVLSMVNAFIRTLIGRGALVDGKCYFLKQNNPPSQLAAGQVVFNYEIMPPPPAETITFQEVININLLKKLTG